MLPFFLIGSAAAILANVSEPLPVQSGKYGYAYAVDFSAQGSASVFNCLKASRYDTVFLRVYDPRSGRGQFDVNAVSNIRQAFSARLGVEVYMTPRLQGTKTGAQQFTEIMNGLNNAGIKLNKIWLQVTSPMNWDQNPINNVFFINMIISTAQKYGIGLGFYTNFYDWHQITNGARINGIQLWYWSVLGGGPRAETAADFEDFRPFANWTKPTVKQFGQVENICGITVNRDVYAKNDSKQSEAATDTPVVGITFENTTIGLLQI